MKKLIFLCAIFSMILVYPLKTLASFAPRFVSLDLYGNCVLALTESGEVYIWGKWSGTNTFDEKYSKTPVLLMKNITDIKSGLCLDEDGTVYNIHSEEIARQVDSLGRIGNNISFIENTAGLVIRDNNLYLISFDENGTPKEEFIKSDVLDVISNGIVYVILDKQGLLLYSSDKQTWTVLADDVISYDFSLRSHTVYHSSVFVVKSDLSLSYIQWKEIDAIENPIHIADNIRDVQSSNNEYIAITNKNEVLEGRIGDGEDANKVIANKRLSGAQSVGIDWHNAKLAIIDGAIWYWGRVIGQPEEHYQSTPGFPIVETQPEPTQLSLDPKENEAVAHNRMEDMLRNLDDEHRLNYLDEHYDYFSENFPDCFSADELEKYNERSTKALSETMNSSDAKNESLSDTKEYVNNNEDSPQSEQVNRLEEASENREASKNIPGTVLAFAFIALIVAFIILNSYRNKNK